METRSESISRGKLAKEIGRRTRPADTIKWDGRERTADAILSRARAGTVSTWGGAPGYPREIFLHPKGFKGPARASDPSVPKGSRVGFTRTGTPYLFG